MKRLYVTAEGQTEESFTNSVLCRHLVDFGLNVLCRRVLTKRDKLKSYRGGIKNYEKVRKDINLWRLEDQSSDARFTTMFDLYALPNNFPGYKYAQKINDPYEKVQFLEQQMYEDIGDRRFIPYIQLHEFESLIFSKLDDVLYEYIDREKEVEELKKQLNDFDDNPELVNEGKETAPSKRILKLIPEYSKVLAGTEITELIGVDYLKENCPHFSEWIQKLETIDSDN